ncbi:MAG: hypothetical protein ACREX0_01975 [Noviherbaspirillum sp.]
MEIHAAFHKAMPAYFEAAGAAVAGAASVGVDAAGADECAGAEDEGVPWPASPIMSTLLPPFMMTKSASSANAMKPTNIFHMICLQDQVFE